LIDSVQRQLPSRRLARGVALVALVLLAALTITGPASAAKSCGKKVVDDWYADGRVDGTYPAHCYDDAIEILPRDVRDYSSAAEDIGRALQNRLRGLPAPPATTDPTPGDNDGPGSSPKPSTEPTETNETPPGTSTDKPGDPDGGLEAGGDVDTASADSVPVPLLVLGGLALLLVAAGSVGYLTRRLQARRVPPPTL
jgi:hypothetical protein